MKIKVNENFASPEGAYAKGRTYDVADDRAAEYIAANLAVAVDEKKKAKDSEAK